MCFCFRKHNRPDELQQVAAGSRAGNPRGGRSRQEQASGWGAVGCFGWICFCGKGPRPGAQAATPYHRDRRPLSPQPWGSCSIPPGWAPRGPAALGSSSIPPGWAPHGPTLVGQLLHPTRTRAPGQLPHSPRHCWPPGWLACADRHVCAGASAEPRAFIFHFIFCRPFRLRGFPKCAAATLFSVLLACKYNLLFASGNVSTGMQVLAAKVPLEGQNNLILWFSRLWVKKEVNKKQPTGMKDSSSIRARRPWQESGTQPGACNRYFSLI